MNPIKRKCNFIIVLFLSSCLCSADAIISKSEVPVVGAQVIVEQGQSRSEIEQMFKILNESNMRICRIRMFESFMKDEAGNWDFTLFDYAFQAAEKYDIRIFATLFPDTNFEDIGGFKFPKSIEHLKSISEYIKQVVTHFYKYKSLYAWVLINEPGNGSAPLNEPFTAAKFNEWSTNFIRLNNSTTDIRPTMPLLEERFLLDYNVWYLNWIAQEIKVIDPGRHLHVNNHAIFNNYSEYDFPKWRLFLNSLGGSAHASWHFELFQRKDYHYAMSATCEIIRSGAGNLPWIMTELQGGNNLWSGYSPMCPTKEEIEQWMWTVIGTGGKGMIFWSLNYRSSGIEAGEWAMLNLLNQPTDRLEKAADVSKIVLSRPDLFNEATVAESGITLLYTRESLWVEKKSQIIEHKYNVRSTDAGMRSIIEFYKAFSQLGIQANIQSIDEYELSDDNHGKVIILAHQIAIPLNYKRLLEKFVSTGGTLIIEGLSGYFDDKMRTQINNHANFSSLFGGRLKEIKHISTIFQTKIDDKLSLPTNLWQSTIHANVGAKVVAKNKEGEATMVSSKIGNGNVLWIPSCIGIAPSITNNSIALTHFIESYIIPSLPKNTIRLKKLTPGVLVKSLQTIDGDIIILLNKNKRSVMVDIINPEAKSVSILNKSDGKFRKGSTKFNLQPEETLVVEYKKSN